MIDWLIHMLALIVLGVVAAYLWLKMNPLPPRYHRVLKFRGRRYESELKVDWRTAFRGDGCE